jgi:SAM-dependent methyltransferase
VEPHLMAAIRRAAPAVPFRAFEVGCGAGATTLDVAQALPNASITACDLSAALVALAKERLSGTPPVELVVGNALQFAQDFGPFDLIYSRHGVMFFDDPVAAFKVLRRAGAVGATVVFSCFAEWEANPWACELAAAAAGASVRRPGRESGGFAFSDPAYVEQIFHSSGWDEVARSRVEFDYVAGVGSNAVEDALGFLSEIGPASVALLALPAQERAAAVDRMRHALQSRCSGDCVSFPATAWVWTATAGEPPA